MARGKRGKGAAANDDTDFDQGGPDGPARLAREAANGADTPGAGHNSKTIDGEFVRGSIEQILAEEASIKAQKDALSKKLQPQRKKIAGIVKSLVQSNISTRVVQTLLKEARTQVKLENIRSELDDDAKNEFALVKEAMGDFADTELGAHALATAAGADTGASASEPVH